MHNTNTKDILLAQNKDEEALARVVENNSGLIWSLVKRFMGRGYSRRRTVSNRSNSDS